jgi:hypothetical protein
MNARPLRFYLYCAAGCVASMAIGAYVALAVAPKATDSCPENAAVNAVAVAPRASATKPKSASAAAVPARFQKVDCSTPSSIWAAAMTEKLRFYRQQISHRWIDEPEVRKRIGSEYEKHQDRIQSSDGSPGACEEISKDLDQWRSSNMKPD